MTISYDQAKQKLESNGQEHVLKFWETMEERERNELLAQVESLDFTSIECMRKLLSSADDGTGNVPFTPGVVQPFSKDDLSEACRIGEGALRRGEVGAVLVAGGQGTRLGFDGPKGSFSIGPITGASLFEVHARKILALERKFGGEVPFYIMTSQANDRPTRDFFRKHDYFGLSSARVLFFTQGMWPALWPDGQIVLECPHRIFLGPDGHGGILAALSANRMLDDMRRRGLRTLFYFQVDNPLVEIAAPVFVGLHTRQEAEMSVKVCAKRDPEEGLGVVVERGGRSAVVEYTELTKEQKHATRPDGQLEFKFGSVAIHIFSLDFLCREAVADLPIHIAHKKVPYCDDEGKTVNPDKPNAYKFEKFIFDALPDAVRTLNVPFARDDEFSPVKNASGSDSPVTAQRDMIRKYARWLEACGVSVPRNGEGESRYKIEIDPCYALGPDDLRQKLPSGFKLSGDTLLA